MSLNLCQCFAVYCSFATGARVEVTENVNIHFLICRFKFNEVFLFICIELEVASFRSTVGLQFQPFFYSSEASSGCKADADKKGNFAEISLEPKKENYCKPLMTMPSPAPKVLNWSFSVYQKKGCGLLS